MNAPETPSCSFPTGVNPDSSASSEAVSRRVWLGWSEPVLPTVVRHLLKRFASASTWDLRGLMIVLPSGLAERRLGELLALEAKRRQVMLYPPQIVTVGVLPEQLYVAKFPFASDLVQQLAWVKALRSAPLAELQQLVPSPPDAMAWQQWLELSKIFSGLHRELASDGLNFAKVAEALGRLHVEFARWQALAKFQRLYLDELDRLELWDVQTARLCALQFKEPRTTKHILMVGCVDLNQVQRGFLQQVGEHVEAWIAAPSECADRFDTYGSLVSAAWQDHQIELTDEQLLVGNSPDDQAQLAGACLAEWGDRFHIREVTLGVPEAGLIPVLQHQLDQAGAATRYGPGTPLVQSEPAMLLSQIGEYVDTRSYAAFSALIRQPVFDSLLTTFKVDIKADWLASIDDYYGEALPKTIDGFIHQEAKGAAEYEQVSKVVDRWLSKLPRKSRSISNWVQPLLSVLATAYGRQTCDLEDPLEGPLHSAATHLSSAILSLRDIPSELEPTMTISEAVAWLLRSLSTQLVPAPLHDESNAAIEMLGWLELAWDDAPALVVVGMHDGVVPESLSADSFLPNSLRRQIGLVDNQRRYARDAYLLQLMLNAREQVRIVVGKTDADGDPLTPSRLLLACDLAKLPDRVLHLVQEDKADVLPPVETRWKKRGGSSQLIVPRPAGFQPPKHMSVTAFRSYLACPYRFYLQHVLRLRDEQDSDAELDAPMFGNLLHDTLELLGKDDIGTCADEQRVRDYLIESLHELAMQRFGPNPPAAVLIQIEQAEQRLIVFAHHQAARAAEGWEIRFVECAVESKDDVRLGHDDEMRLIGRIDRIDYHPATKRWAIWDYKTSETAKNPVAAHWSKTEGWKDLQLPLYLPVAAKLGVPSNATLGYIAIPSKASETKFVEANFSSVQIREALAVANEVASKVAAGEFWPDKLGAVHYDDFARICQSDVQHVTVPPPVRKLRRHSDLVAMDASTASTVSVDLNSVDASTVEQARRLLALPTQVPLALPPLLIRASAGTGKTFQLTNRLLQIILSGQDVDGILASTFTRKAAGEILHRVLQRLAQGCISEPVRREFAEHLPGVSTTAADCLAALQRVTRSLNRVRIETLDSFFAQLARTFSLEMGLPTGWSPMDPLEEPQLKLQATSQMLDNHDRKTLVTLMRMLDKGDSVRQISKQIINIVSSGYKAYRITDASAWDQLPLPSAPSEAAVDSALRTIETTQIGHKSADQILLKVVEDGRTGNWESLVLRGVYGKVYSDAPTYYGRELGSGLVAALQLLAERAAAELLPLRRNQTLASYQLLEAYDRQYTSLIRRQRLLAFADVAYFLSRWMLGVEESETLFDDQLRNKRAAQLEFRLDCRVQHLLLDEFQDTAPEQWQILRPLAEPLGGAQQPDKSFFCVGDTKQAIYGWRGGVAEIFDSVQQTVSGLKQSEMSQSHRSSPEVIQAVNAVFQHLSDHQNFGGCEATAIKWSQQFPEHRTTRTNLPGYVLVQNGPKVQSGGEESAQEEFLTHAAGQILELTKQTTASVGVLLRTNDDVARMIALLRDRRVSASQDGGNPLSDSAAVELILSLLHLADHPGDSTCAFHVGTSPLATKLPFKASADRVETVKLADWVRCEVMRRGLGRTVELLADGLADKLAWWDQYRLEQLISSAYEFQPAFQGRLRDFEESVMRNHVALPSESQVKVMTIHKSKGLEFDAVFLPQLDINLGASSNLLVMRGEDPCEPPDGVLRHMNAGLQALLPDDWQRAFEQYKQRGLVESLCLLYVAMTRARQALYMTTKPSAKDCLQNFSSLLQSTLGGSLNRSSPEQVLYESGNAKWFGVDKVRIDRPADDGQVLDLDGQTQPPSALGKVRLRKDGLSSPSRGMRVTAPSSQPRSVEPVSLASVFSFSHNIGATYGSLIHAFFEQVDWLEDFRFDRDELRRVALAKIDAEALRHLSLENAIDDFESMLALPSIQSALSRSRYRHGGVAGVEQDRVEIDNNRPVSLVMDGKVISASLDRLAVLFKDDRPIAAEIIDFKTDKFDPNLSLLWLDERIEHHQPQMAIYADAVAQMLGIPRQSTATYLLFLSTDELVRGDLASANC